MYCKIINVFQASSAVIYAKNSCLLPNFVQSRGQTKGDLNSIPCRILAVCHLEISTRLDIVGVLVTLGQASGQHEYFCVICHVNPHAVLGIVQNLLSFIASKQGERGLY